MLHDTVSQQKECEVETYCLSDCLELFLLAEKLGKDDPWYVLMDVSFSHLLYRYCSKCKEFRQATKKLDLWRLPPILVVHLKRFCYRNRYYRQKLETFIDFPLKNLDLSPYCLTTSEHQPQYDLFAVSVSSRLLLLSVIVV